MDSLLCTTATHTAVLISVKLAISQTPADTARPRLLASALRGVPVYFSSFCCILKNKDNSI